MSIPATGIAWGRVTRNSAKEPDNDTTKVKEVFNPDTNDSDKSEYIKDQLNENRDNPKKFWKRINSEIIPEKHKSTFNFVNQENDTLFKEEEIPNIINDYFSEIGPNLASKISNHNVGEQPVDHQNPNIFELEEFTLPELIGYIKAISLYKSSGIKHLSSRFIRDAMLYIPQVFLHLYNIVRLNGDFPDPWKIATVIPLPKNNDPKNSSELRPISLLPIVGKILEKLIHNQFSKFLENTHYLSGFQHGFRKEHSTTSATTKFVDNIMLNLDRGHHTIAVFLDIKDRVCRFCGNLRKIGIS